MYDIRFTATIQSGEYETHFFRTEDDFIEYLDTLWGHHGGYPHDRTKRIQHRVLRDREPRQYPCLMISAGERELNNGQDEIQNIFLYDIEIHEGLDEDEE